MTTDDHTYAQSSTWNEIGSQVEVWQTVIAHSRDSQATKDILSCSAGPKEWLFVGCGTSFYLAEAAAVSWQVCLHPAAATEEQVTAAEPALDFGCPPIIRKLYLHVVNHVGESLHPGSGQDRDGSGGRGPILR